MKNTVLVWVIIVIVGSQSTNILLQALPETVDDTALAYDWFTRTELYS